MKVEFHPAASAEFQAASAYHEKEVSGLGEAFISEVERVAELMKRSVICSSIRRRGKL